MRQSFCAVIHGYLREELIYILVVVLLVSVLVLAWMSTYVRNELRITYHVFHLVHSPHLRNSSTTELNQTVPTASNLESLTVVSENNSLPPQRDSNNETESNRRYTLALAAERILESVHSNQTISTEEDEEPLNEIEPILPVFEHDLPIFETGGSSTSSTLAGVNESTQNYSSDIKTDLQVFHSGQENKQEEAMAQSTSDRPQGSILVRLKYLNDEQKLVFALPTDTITVFKRTHFQHELSDNKIVRLIFCGRELKETANACLMEYGINEDATIHCLITQGAAPDNSDSSSRNGADMNRLGSSHHQGVSRSGASGSTPPGMMSEIDLGVFMFPSFGFLLGAIWYSRVVYRQYFNVMSTFGLLGVSVLYLITLFTFWTTRYSNDNNQSSSTSSSSIPVISHHAVTNREPVNESTASTTAAPLSAPSGTLNSPFTVGGVFHYHIHSRAAARRLRVQNSPVSVSIPPISDSISSTVVES